jgi:hypothetical protein
VGSLTSHNPIDTPPRPVAEIALVIFYVDANNLEEHTASTNGIIIWDVMLYNPVELHWHFWATAPPPSIFRIEYIKQETNSISPITGQIIFHVVMFEILMTIL